MDLQPRAKMLAQAGTPLGMEFMFLCPNEEACAAPWGRHLLADFDDTAALDRLRRWADVVTFEFDLALELFQTENGLLANEIAPRVHGLLAAAHAERASLIVLTIDHASRVQGTVTLLRDIYPGVPIVARARDLEDSARLLQAGATQAYPEAIEASLRLGATALQMVGAPADDYVLR